MNSRVFYDDATGKYWQRVSKARAKKGFGRGESVVLCAVNMRPFSHWNYSIAHDVTGDIKNFDVLVNGFEWYNCINSETGLYSAFYIKLEQ